MAHFVKDSRIDRPVVSPRPEVLIAMNAQRHSQLEHQLATQEQTLLARLRFLLPDSARPGSSIFTAPAHTPAFGHIYFVPPVREDLCVIASDCVRLRKRMSLPAKGTLAQTLLDACSGGTGAHEAQCQLAGLLRADR